MQLAAHAFGHCDPNRHIADMLGRDAEPPSDSAISAPKNSGVDKLWRCSLKSQVQFDAPDCEKSIMRLSQPVKDFVPPRPRQIRTGSEVAKNIRLLRESRNETQTQFAAAIGALPSVVSKWEAGKNRPNRAVFSVLAALAAGDARRFFLKEAGLSFKENGDLDFGLDRLAQQIRKDAIIGLNHHAKNEKAGQLSQPEATYTWNPDLLLAIINMLAGGFKKKGSDPTDPKFGQLVLLCYELCNGDEARVAESVERMLRLVA